MQLTEKVMLQKKVAREEKQIHHMQNTNLYIFNMQSLRAPRPPFGTVSQTYTLHPTTLIKIFVCNNWAIVGSNYLSVNSI